MYNLINNFKTQNIKKIRKLQNSKKKLQKFQKNYYLFIFLQNLKYSCFHISLWNFEKQEFVQMAYGS
jgi:hypothetical protein